MFVIHTEITMQGNFCTSIKKQLGNCNLTISFLNVKSSTQILIPELKLPWQPKVNPLMCYEL